MDDNADFDLNSVSGHGIKKVPLPIVGQIQIKSVTELSPFDALLHCESIDLTGHKIWESCVMLCEYLSTVYNRQDKFDILELGSGTGVAGIYLAKLGHRVTVSDAQATVLELLRENCKLNDVDCNVLEINWLDYKIKSNLYDVVVASDCCYERDVLEQLFATAFHALKKDHQGFLVANVQNRLFCSVKVANKILEEIALKVGFVRMTQVQHECIDDAQVVILLFQ